MESIRLVPAYDNPNEVGILFSEYTDMLLAEDQSFEACLRLQNYDEELVHLDKKYGRPDGRLYLVYCGEKLAGCIGLKKFDEQNGEVKRLYVRPGFRGKHLGELLLKQIINDAREIGYSHLLLDTLPFLKSAVRLYENHGFYRISGYYDNPISEAIYMRLDL